MTTDLYKIYYFLDHIPVDEWDIPPHHIDYRTAPKVRLVPKRTFVKGELVMVEYYETWDQENDVYTNLIVREDIAYHRKNGFVSHREMIITWFLDDENGSASPKTKSRIKYYSGPEAIEEGKRRRYNIVNQLSINATGMIAIAEQLPVEQAAQIGAGFINQFVEEVTSFERSGDPALKNAVAAASDSFLDKPAAGQADGVTIRDYMVEELTV